MWPFSFNANYKSKHCTYPRELFRQTIHKFLVFGAIITRVKNHNNASNVGAGNWNTKYRLDSALSGPTAALEVISRGIVNKLFPRRMTRLVDTSRQSRAHVERKFLAVVAKRVQIELLFGENLTRRLGVVANHRFGGGVSRVAKTARRFVPFLISVPGNKRRHPEIYMLEGHAVALQKRRDLGEKGGRVQQTALLGGVQSNTRTFTRQHVEDFSLNFLVVHVGVLDACKGAGLGFRALDENTLFEILGIRAERHTHHELALGHASFIARFGAALVHLLARGQVVVG